MQPDDLYQNDGTYFMPREPEEQIIARKKEQAQTLEAIKVIDTVIEHFDQRIDYLGSIDSITENLETDPLSHQKAFHVKKLLKQALEEERILLQDLLDIHDKR